jgi:hypothetical protein
METKPTGAFTCDVTLQRIRGVRFVREEKDGVTYLTGRDYELAYETTLCFANGAELPIKARLYGELNQQVVIRDAAGKPVQTSGYVQGRSEIRDSSGTIIFRGRYYDARVVQSLIGDEALTAAGPRLLERHLENGLGEGSYAGHAFSLSGQLHSITDACRRSVL